MLITGCSLTFHQKQSIDMLIPNPAERAPMLSIQSITAFYNGDNTDIPQGAQSFQAMVHNDGKMVKISMLTPEGLRFWTINFDGQNVDEQRFITLPSHLQAHHILNSVALIFWPESSILSKYPQWKIVSENMKRRIYDSRTNENLYTIQTVKKTNDQTSISFYDHTKQYRLLIVAKDIR